MKVAIMGTGGVGGYFGSKLALGGCDVSFIARGADLAAIKAGGLRVKSALGDLHVSSPKATDSPGEVGVVDVVLFGVKLWDTESAAEAIRPLVGPQTLVISLQNGVVKDELLTAALGPHAVAGGVCYIAATIVEPGVIGHAGTMQKLVFGETESGRPNASSAFARPAFALTSTPRSAMISPASSGRSSSSWSACRRPPPQPAVRSARCAPILRRADCWRR